MVILDIENHKLLLDREVSLADISDARTARARALKEYEKSERETERRDFEACKLSLSPRLYDQEMERMEKGCCKNTCAWLDRDEDFETWFSSRKRSSAFLWLSGIPGAGQYREHLILPFFLSDLISLSFPAFFTFDHNCVTVMEGFQEVLLSSWLQDKDLRRSMKLNLRFAGLQIF